MEGQHYSVAEFEQSTILDDQRLTTLKRIQVNMHCYNNSCYPQKMQSQEDRKHVYGN
jgi:hypothetical protein